MWVDHNWKMLREPETNRYPHLSLFVDIWYIIEFALYAVLVLILEMYQLC